MKTTLVLLTTVTLFLLSCKKESFVTPATEEACLIQTGDPSGRSYSADSLVAFNCTSKYCGILPLSTKNYWVYEDSVFSKGVFLRVQYDTLRFTRTWKSLADGLVWWESNISAGLPEKLYANDSSIFMMEDRLFIPGIMDVKKDYTLFPGDSIRFLFSFSDNAAICRSLKVRTAFQTPAGTFSDYIYYEKNAPYFRKDQTWLKPGIGVIKYIREKAVLGSPQVKLDQISTLISYHIE